MPPIHRVLRRASAPGSEVSYPPGQEHPSSASSPKLRSVGLGCPLHLPCIHGQRPISVLHQGQVRLQVASAGDGHIPSQVAGHLQLVPLFHSEPQFMVRSSFWKPAHNQPGEKMGASSQGGSLPATAMASACLLFPETHCCGPGPHTPCSSGQLTVFPVCPAHWAIHHEQPADISCTLSNVFYLILFHGG